LHPARLKELIDHLHACFQAVRNEMEAFADFLEKIE
jgi:hypothetical protein